MQWVQLFFQLNEVVTNLKTLKYAMHPHSFHPNQLLRGKRQAKWTCNEKQKCNKNRLNIKKLTSHATYIPPVARKVTLKLAQLEILRWKTCKKLHEAYKPNSFKCEKRNTASTSFLVVSKCVICFRFYFSKKQQFHNTALAWSFSKTFLAEAVTDKEMYTVVPVIIDPLHP